MKKIFLVVLMVLTLSVISSCGNKSYVSVKPDNTATSVTRKSTETALSFQNIPDGDLNS